MTDKLTEARAVLCQRLRLHGMVKHADCDGRILVCGFCDHTARQILEAVKEQPK